MYSIQISSQDFLKECEARFPTPQQIEDFKQKISILLQTNPNETEEHHKNAINQFLNHSFDYKMNTKGRIDSAIYDENEVKVILEVKALNNQSEFPSNPDTLESKALYESILYYLRESKNNHNNHIKHIILCNLKSFYIIDAKEFEKNFASDKFINKLYKDTQHKEGNDTSTKRFYEEIKTYLKDNEFQIPYVYFELDKNIQEDSDELALIYQILSPACLLKQRSYIDANLLNQNFYDELLYILGLEEKKEEGKIIITSSEEKNTMLDSIVKELGLKRNLDFETIFSLLTTWNNRILFLRLLESMLLSFKHIQKPFLHIESIPDFDTLNTLFFEVLAQKEEVRKDIPEVFKSIPYLNSSLFEKTALEDNENQEGGGHNNKLIKSLKNKPLTIYKNSILKKESKYSHSLPLLEYFFAFLSAYDFTTTPKDIQNNIKINPDKLINSAVLGLVFEKLNGYKEGSFYTPSAITNYMCKENIESIVLDKFNTQKNWQCKNLTELYNKIDDIQEANKIFHTIRICDPAVGSGHFLVSVLNELIFIKYECGLLCDEEGKRLKNIQLELKNDEIIILDSNGEIFNYELPGNEKVESHLIQKVIFHTKKDIIENCLFGVDINQNSCEITKLRLWIELLKNTYYENIHKLYLQTLPNIDINIKDGNSLVSFFPIDSVFKIGLSNSFSQNLKESINDYKTQVSLYKEALGDKEKIRKKIKNIQTMFLTYLTQNHLKNTALNKNLSDFISEYGDSNTYFDMDEPFGMEMIKLSRKNNYKFSPTLTDPEPKAIDKNGDKLLASLREDFTFLESIKASNSFEWRFAFPEVLDENGDFIGFDLVIGNPPYIRQENIQNIKPHLQNHFSIYNGTADIYTYFFEQSYKILKESGKICFITSNKWTRAGYGKALRTFILQKAKIESYTDFNGIKVFDSASVDTSIITLKKQVSKNNDFKYLEVKQKPKDAKELLSLSKTILNTSSLSNDSFTFSDPFTQKIKEKIQSIGTPLKDWDIQIYRGNLTGYNEAFIIDTDKKDEILTACDDSPSSNLPFLNIDGQYIACEKKDTKAIMLNEKQRTEHIIKPILRGRDIKKYSYQWAGKWLIFLPWHFPNTQKPKSMKENEEDLSKYYPSLYQHLLLHKTRLSQRNKDETGIRYEWYCLQRWGPNYWRDFDKQKIIYPNMAKEFVAFLDNKGFMVNQKCFILTDKSIDKNRLPYLTAIFNSKANFWYFKQIGATLGASGYEMSKIFVDRLPIPEHKDEGIFKEIESLSLEILQAKEDEKSQKETKSKENIKAKEKKLDSIIYQLYTLSSEEIDFIESEFTSTEREREREREREQK